MTFTKNPVRGQERVILSLLAKDSSATPQNDMQKMLTGFNNKSRGGGNGDEKINPQP
jgi:hypothetical protein